MRLGQVSDQFDVRRFVVLAYLRKNSGFRRVTSRTLMTGAILLANIVPVVLGAQDSSAMVITLDERDDLVQASVVVSE